MEDSIIWTDQELAEILTVGLEARMDLANKDPRLQNKAALKLAPNHLPIRRAEGWPSFSNGVFAWNLAYEAGQGTSTGVFYVSYYTDPTGYFAQGEKSSNPKYHSELRDQWLRANPELDLTKGLFEVIKSPINPNVNVKEPSNMVLTTDYRTVLSEFDSFVKSLAKSRLSNP